MKGLYSVGGTQMFYRVFLHTRSEFLLVSHKGKLAVVQIGYATRFFEASRYIKQLNKISRNYGRNGVRSSLTSSPW